MSEELKPCPFCGSKEIVASNVGEEEDNWFVGCMERDCQVNPGVFNPDSEAEAVAAWNRRPSPPVVDGELPEPGIFVNLTTLKWWRELVDLNPADLAPRLDSQIKMALSKSPRSEGDK